jgi:Putative homoserine kinase type II (protein kinase fold)
MAVYTRINRSDLNLIEKNFKIGKIKSFSGIKKGIENTNYLIKTDKKKIILTIFEKRVHKRDLPFFMNLMFGLSKKKIKCPEPIKNKKGQIFILN